MNYCLLQNLFSTQEFNEDTKTYNLILGDISEDFMEALEVSLKSEAIAKFKRH